MFLREWFGVGMARNSIPIVGGIKSLIFWSIQLENGRISKRLGWSLSGCHCWYIFDPMSCEFAGLLDYSGRTNIR